jgi:hypothetical protein
MIRAFAIAAALGFVLSEGADAAPCRDAKGKFIACPSPAATAVKCRDKTTKKFAKCSAPNTEPMPAVAAK